MKLYLQTVGSEMKEVLIFILAVINSYRSNRKSVVWGTQKQIKTHPPEAAKAVGSQTWLFMVITW